MDVSASAINHIVSIKKNDIKHAVIKSDHPIDFVQKVRLLQGIIIDDPYLQTCLSVFQKLLSVSRIYS